MGAATVLDLLFD